MSSKKQKLNKTQTLTIRIDDKTRFQLEFAARITGMTITTFVERAVRDSVQNIEVQYIPKKEEELSSNQYYTWYSFWDPDESIRTITLLNTPEISEKYTSYEEDQFIAFLRYHWMFFAKNQRLHKESLSREHLNALWPHLEELSKTWYESRSENMNCVEAELVTLLASANLRPIGTINSDEIPF